MRKDFNFIFGNAVLVYSIILIVFASFTIHYNGTSNLDTCVVDNITEKTLGIGIYSLIAGFIVLICACKLISIKPADTNDFDGDTCAACNIVTIFLFLFCSFLGGVLSAATSNCDETDDKQERKYALIKFISTGCNKEHIKHLLLLVLWSVMPGLILGAGLAIYICSYLIKFIAIFIYNTIRDCLTEYFKGCSCPNIKCNCKFLLQCKTCICSVMGTCIANCISKCIAMTSCCKCKSSSAATQHNQETVSANNSVAITINPTPIQETTSIASQQCNQETIMSRSQSYQETVLSRSQSNQETVIMARSQSMTSLPPAYDSICAVPPTIQLSINNKVDDVDC